MSTNQKVMKINKTKGIAGSRAGRPSLRRCVACRQMMEKAHLMRVSKSPDGGFALDATGKSPGRGAYVCKDEVCLAKVAKMRGFDRSLKKKVPEEVYAQLEGVSADG